MEFARQMTPPTHSGYAPPTPIVQDRAIHAAEATPSDGLARERNSLDARMRQLGVATILALRLFELGEFLQLKNLGLGALLLGDMQSLRCAQAVCSSLCGLSRQR